jgi:cytochrome P450 family 110
MVSSLPSGPKESQFLQILRWTFTPLQFLDRSAARYGDSFTLRLSRPLVMLSHPEAIRQVITADPQTIHSGEANSLLRPFVGDFSIFLLDGPAHQRQRQLLMPPFHGERLKVYDQLIRDSAQAALDALPKGEPFAVRKLTQQISLRVILRAVFGLEGGDRARDLALELAQLIESTASPLQALLIFLPQLQKDLGAWSPWGQFLQRRQQLDALLYSEIHHRRNQSHSKAEDILSLLLEARDAEGQTMSDPELRDELLTMLMAGHETTATALAWALYWIHALPEVKSQVEAELHSSNGDSSAQLPYLQALCQETLRIFPVAPIAFIRLLQRPLVVMGQEYPEGTRLTPCIYLLHRRPELYPQGEKFRPERFLEWMPGPYEYLPFGGGNRRCIGAALAMLELRLVLAKLLRDNQFRILNTKPVQPRRRGVTLASEEIWLEKL